MTAPDLSRQPWERVLARAAAVSGIALEAILGRSRKAEVVRVRWAVVVVLAEAGSNDRAIGRRLGGREHTTIHHARQCGRARLARDPEFAWLVGELRKAASLDGRVSTGLDAARDERNLAVRLDPKPRAAAAVPVPVRSSEFDHRWCEQCDRRVAPAVAARCASRFCSLARACLDFARHERG